MNLWAIVPAKPLRRGKSRLAPVLSEDERFTLNFNMLKNTLQTLATVPEITQTLVVSRDPAALVLAREYKARTVQEDGAPGLNMALERATVVAQLYTAQGVLIIPSDLPLLSGKEIQDFISRASRPPMMVIAPDRREDGTNGLLVSPLGAVTYCFGPGSFQKHLALAQEKGMQVEVYRSQMLGLDLDLPEDLELLKKMEVSPVNL